VQIEVVGSRGRLQISNPYKPGTGEQITLTRGDRTEAISIPDQELYIGEVEDMADAILTGKPPRITLGDSRGNLASILAFIQSAQTGKVERPEG
jgi:predicted dehydrogenase